MAWLDTSAWVSSEREAVMWSRERKQRNEVREREQVQFSEGMRRQREERGDEETEEVGPARIKK